ncbi:hypothetical protein L2E82_18154 [Cichorium intybus]|uniref:Uncharacterized protein n=1 Tax=Cichorium intybus TaxID=13427 RepID=A0ACB9F9E7_CICIN|nr:hypothetical protein L2E82_18154 [Cichorium intybus]
MAGDGAAAAPLLDTGNGEELMHVQPAVSIVLGNHPPESPGTLYISTKDPEAFSSPCIYTQHQRSQRSQLGWGIAVSLVSL